MTDAELSEQHKIFLYKGCYGLPLSGWDRFTNWLWYWAGEQNQLWAKIPHYSIQWIEQRSFDISCLLGRHFYINSETECERCRKVKL